MKNIASFIKNANSIAIFSHIKTDCDAVCSSLALKLLVEKLGKKADVFIDSSFSHQMHSLPYFDTINTGTNSKYDLYVCLDCATQDRLGKNKYKIMKNRAKSVQIDHHGTNEKYCKYNYIREKASSTCELIADFSLVLGVEIDNIIAKLLLTGIYTDTGKLSFSNTTPHTLSVASGLLTTYGESMAKVCEPIFSSKTFSEFELTKLAYDRLKFYENNKIALMTIDKADFERLNISMDETHGLADIGTSLEDVQIMFMISEDTEQNDCYYVSIRSKGDVSSRQVAESFGGGGHINASGCKVFDTKQNLIDKLLVEGKKVIK